MITRTAALAASAMASIALAGPSGGSYEIVWSTIDGGGGSSSGGTYTIEGTIGQHDAAPPSSGGAYTLAGGYWPGVGITAGCNPADLDGNGVLNFDDIDAFVNGFLGGDLIADLDGNGVLNFDDIDAFVNNFLAGCP